VRPPYIVDADAHLLEQDGEIRRLLPEPWNRATSYLPRDEGFNRTLFGTLGPRTAGPQQHLRDMDVEGIDLAILYPSMGLFIGEVRTPEFEAAYCRAYNDWVASFCAVDRGRLKAVALVPLQDVTAGCRELARAVGTLGLVGAMVPSSFRYGPPNVGDPYFDPFYAEAERLGVPVAIHHTGGLTGDLHRFRHFLQIHLLSHVPEQMAAVVAMVIGGVFERFPRLKVGFMEAGCGWVPFWLEHMDGEFAKRHRETPWLKRKPSEYIIDGSAYFGVEPEETLLPLVASSIGAGKLLYASDYPHWDTDWPHTVETLVARTDLSDGQRRQIMCDNALAFYGLAAAVHS
jgi:predicted TIM-barrel fold metal-dependent hydrolase